ncbi:hypothetical protein RCL_jg13932.t1 [Rhizophagus clarus]|uniref:Uncharacterized protein n=1 Tax=Rhizophagus clarus TaxID=94130 RepID=A0A8H3QUA6_9GLOM|nr:hypothetical protein RCL_jg13932.t1 [Rhizophagus clarus]
MNQTSKLHRIIYGCGFPLYCLAKLENLKHFKLESCSITGLSKENVGQSSFQRFTKEYLLFQSKLYLIRIHFITTIL